MRSSEAAGNASTDTIDDGGSLNQIHFLEIYISTLKVCLFVIIFPILSFLSTYILELACTASGFTLYSSHNIFSTTTVAAEAVGERGLQSYYGCQPLLNTISFTGNSSRNRNDKMILDGLTEALDCDCALSLLSPPPPQHQQPSPSTQTLNLSHQHHSHSHMILPHSGTDHTFPQQYGSGFNRYSSRSQSSPDASTTGEFSCSGIIDDPRSNVLDLQSSSIFGGSTSPHGDGGHSILLPYSWP